MNLAMSADRPGREGQRSLDVFEVGTLLQVLAQSQKAGTLRIASGSRTKYVTLRGGRIESIHTPRSKYRIGRILYNMGSVEMEDLRRVLPEADAEDTPIGAALLKQGLINNGQLEAALGYQMVEELLEVFFWKDLEYEFFEGPAEERILRNTQGMTRVGGSREAQGILLEVTRILDELEKFESATPSQHDVYEAVGDPVQFLAEEGASQQEQEVARLIDGERDLAEVVRDARMNRFDVMGLFYRLKSAGILRPKNAFELLMISENRREALSPSKRVRLLERAEELGLDGFDLAHRLARVYEEKGDGARAAAKFVEHAREMIRRGNFPAAREVASRAVRADPANTTVREFRARLLGESHASEEMVEEVLAIARLHVEGGRPSSADRVLRASLARVPGEKRILEARIDALRRMGKRRAASAAAMELSAVHEKKGNAEPALTAMRRAVGLATDWFRPHRTLVDLLDRAGQRALAAAEIGALAEVAGRRLADKPVRMKRVLGLLVDRLAELRSLGSPAMESIARHYLAMEDEEKTLEILVAAGEARVADQAWEEARNAYAAAVELRPDDLDLSETLVLVHSKVGNRDEAVARLRTIASELEKRGQIDRAERAVSEALRLSPFSPETLLELARLREAQGDRSGAAARLHQVGELHRAAGNLEAATEFYENACRLEPSSPDYTRSLASCLSRALKTQGAMKTYENLLAMLKARSDHVAVLEIALLMLDVSPGHAAAIEALREAHRALGERVEAEEREAGQPA